MKMLLMSLVLIVPLARPCAADERKTDSRPAIRLADLVALPTKPYRMDPYLRAAEALQALGQEKACVLLRELAAKDPWPHTRTLTLCRMLFQAKPKGNFRRPAIGAPSLFGGTESEDWPLEPIEIVEGVPFLITTGYLLAGFPEPAPGYVGYCVSKCDWNRTAFKPRSKEEKRKALDKLLSSPKLKGKLDEGDRQFFEDQIK